MSCREVGVPGVDFILHLVGRSYLCPNHIVAGIVIAFRYFQVFDTLRREHAFGFVGVGEDKDAFEVSFLGLLFESGPFHFFGCGTVLHEEERDENKYDERVHPIEAERGFFAS